jgi:hypothetical protein
MKKSKAVPFALVLASITINYWSSGDSGSAPTVTGKWNPEKKVTKIGTTPNQTQIYDGHEAGCLKDFIEFLGTNSGGLRDVI